MTEKRNAVISGERFDIDSAVWNALAKVIEALKTQSSARTPLQITGTMDSNCSTSSTFGGLPK